jgi:hypothetical protein
MTDTTPQPRPLAGDELMCVRCNQKPAVHEFICADCLYDDYNREFEDNQRLRELVHDLSALISFDEVELWERISALTEAAPPASDPEGG